jgi:hypothetical protein
MTAQDFAAAVQKAAKQGLKAARQAGGASMDVTPYKVNGQTATVRQNLVTGWVKIIASPVGSPGRAVRSFQKGKEVFSSPSQTQVSALRYFALPVPKYVDDPTADRAYYPLATLLALRDEAPRKITTGLSEFTQTTVGSGVELSAVVTGTSERAVYTVDGQGRLASVSLPAIGSAAKTSRTYTYKRPAFPIPPTNSVARQSDVDAAVYAYLLRIDVNETAKKNGRIPTTKLLLDRSKKVGAGQASVSRSNTTVTVTSPARIFTMQVFDGTVMVTYRAR